MFDLIHQEPIILASGSKSRQHLLKSVGLDFKIIPSGVDETAVKNDFKKDWLSLAVTLAHEKALTVSKRFPDTAVIAADQLCILDNEYFDKPITHANAVGQLQRLSGKKHQLFTAVCIAKNNRIIWQQEECPELTMHTLSMSTIQAYLHQEQPYQSCGSYHYEGMAKWLFKEVSGAESTIMGLPLQSLVNALLSLEIVTIA
ncbi:Maf family protein [Legionella septentrionalis]|uniref:Nucleoside triphosphate pyrophosphatase n=1 Tax=Legionella septentrionalis TaxID=2498109 RepID=A0A3S0VN44_9GAMM|nr:nucleoside triphosphate pyrophosphatase [Legionella septentrionalis]RUQ88070.1 septum formation protein Maf [Legionella septentrionalis]RUR02449.1 septum formation protein Maf [Legionella septentrionalis]RUR09306.1 septum formation protein Maf [Legionella septentrionalis]